MHYQVMKLNTPTVAQVFVFTSHIRRESPGWAGGYRAFANTSIALRIVAF